jgi:hypothetical protein
MAMWRGVTRIAYQGYDLLFDPELPLRTLPIGNRYVMRIQAVYATLDYLSQALGSSRQGSVWLDLSTSTDSNYQRARQTALAGLVRRILTIPTELDRYTAYLASALKVDEGAIAPLLWDHPRPLMTQVLPTALRRLESNWRAWGQSGADFQVFNSPLPEFAPANLFSDLNPPEVNIVLPQPGGATPDEVAMPIAQALREFAPGRVSRRYGISHAFERHWMCPALDQNHEQMVPLEPFARLDRLGDWQISIAGSVRQIPVFRPRRLEVQPPPRDVVDTSNARLRWQSQLVAREPGLVFEPPRGSPWTPLIEDVRFIHGAGIVALGYVMEVLALLDGARQPEEFARGLGCLADRTAWTSGEWDFGDGDRRHWRAIQNVNRDIVTLAQHLIGFVRSDIRRRRSETPADAVEREALAHARAVA